MQRNRLDDGDKRTVRGVGSVAHGSLSSTVKDCVQPAASVAVVPRQTSVETTPTTTAIVLQVLHGIVCCECMAFGDNVSPMLTWKKDVKRKL
jgi:hypothetical protein